MTTPTRPYRAIRARFFALFDAAPIIDAHLVANALGETAQ